MYFNKINGGDSIAHEFLRLMGNSPGFQKEASEYADDKVLIDLKETRDSINEGKAEGEARAEKNKLAAENYDPSETEKKVADMFVSKSDGEKDPNVNELDDQISNYASRVFVSNALKIANVLKSRGLTKEAHYLMNAVIGQAPSLTQKDRPLNKNNKIMAGLNKIASSLRAKGENFAADVVDATALSIKQDIRKKAQSSVRILNTLTKMASGFDRTGDRFAGDMVRTTIHNIKKKAGHGDFLAELGQGVQGDFDALNESAANLQAQFADLAPVNSQGIYWPDEDRGDIKNLQAWMGLPEEAWDGLFGRNSKMHWDRVVGRPLPETVSQARNMAMAAAQSAQPGPGSFTPPGDAVDMVSPPLGGLSG